MPHMTLSVMRGLAQCIDRTARLLRQGNPGACNSWGFPQSITLFYLNRTAHPKANKQSPVSCTTRTKYTAAQGALNHSEFSEPNLLSCSDTTVNNVYSACYAVNQPHIFIENNKLAISLCRLLPLAFTRDHLFSQDYSLPVLQLEANQKEIRLLERQPAVR